MTRMVRRTALVSLAALSLVACGSDAAQVAETAAPTTAPTTSTSTTSTSTTSTTTTTTGASGPWARNGSMGSCRVFPADNAWNRDVSALPVDANSANYVSSIGLATTLHADFGPLVTAAHLKKVKDYVALGIEEGAARDIVMLNAGVALYAADVAPTMADGIALAREALQSGRARDKLHEFVGATQALAAA